MAIRPTAPWHDKFAGGGDRLLAGWLRMVCRAKLAERVDYPDLDTMADALSVPRDLLDDMVRRELVDVARRTGRVSIHDWSDHQVTYDVARYRELAAARQARKRARDRAQEDDRNGT